MVFEKLSGVFIFVEEFGQVIQTMKFLFKYPTKYQ